MPTFLAYKYRHVNQWSLDTIRSGRMWFARPASLNDSFEFSLPNFYRLGPDGLVEHFERRFNVSYSSTSVLDAMMKFGGRSEFPISEEFVNAFLVNAAPDERVQYVVSTIHFLRAQGYTTGQIAEKLGLQFGSELALRLERDIQEIHARAHKIGQDYGVLSLAGQPDNALMWAHYADSGRGICLEIEFDVDVLAQSKFLPLPMEYSPELPSLKVDAVFNKSVENEVAILRAFYGTKYDAWKYENEFRLLSTKGDVLLSIPGRFKTIVLGEKCGDSDSQSVIDAARKAGDLSACRIMRVPGTWNYAVIPVPLR